MVESATQNCGVHTYQTSIDELAVDGSDKASAVELPSHDGGLKMLMLMLFIGATSMTALSQRREPPAEWIWSRGDDDTGPALRQRKRSERLVTRFGDPLAGNQGE
jgi:hypothetical protein